MNAATISKLIEIFLACDNYLSLIFEPLITFIGNYSSVVLSMVLKISQRSRYHDKLTFFFSTPLSRGIARLYLHILVNRSGTFNNWHISTIDQYNRE